MKKILSYSLFAQRENVARPYDKHRANVNRYWFNIPFLVICNSLFYPNFITRFYIHKNMSNKNLFSLLKKINASFDNVELVVKKDIYSACEPMLWRLFPLLEKDVKYCFCRDIDSTPNERELRSVLFFIQSGLWVHSMRTHPYHNGLPIFGGLCGFNVEKLREKNMIGNKFENSIRWKKTYKFGEDQGFLGRYFYKTYQKYRDKYLDSPINSPCWGKKAVKIRGRGTTYYDDSHYQKVDISYVNEKCLQLSNSVTKWPGQPVNARGGNLSDLLNDENLFSEKMKKIIVDDKFLKKFYKI